MEKRKKKKEKKMSRLFINLSPIAKQGKWVMADKNII